MSLKDPNVVNARTRKRIALVIANPAGGTAHASGNHMALANIRERLALYYDLEARLDIEEAATHYLVRIVLPCRTRNHPSPS